MYITPQNRSLYWGIFSYLSQLGNTVSIIHSLTHSLAHSLTRSLTHSPYHSLAYSFTRLIIYLLNHPLAYSSTRLFIVYLSRVLCDSTPHFVAPSMFLQSLVSLLLPKCSCDLKYGHCRTARGRVSGLDYSRCFLSHLHGVPQLTS